MNMDEQSCYVYKPLHKTPRKKRRVENDCLDASLRRRRQLYQEHWKTQEEQIDVRSFLGPFFGPLTVPNKIRIQ